MTSTAAPKARPLSPHLQIYKPQLTSGLSILHRITGVGLCGGIVILVLWLAALAGGSESYASFTTYATTCAGQAILLGLTFAFFFHLCCGIRHLLWDAGLFLDLKGAYKTGYLAITAAIILTAFIWLQIYGATL